MSAETRGIPVLIYVRDMEDLPAGASADDVEAAVRLVIKQALERWMTNGGVEYLLCDPDV